MGRVSIMTTLTETEPTPIPAEVPAELRETAECLKRASVLTSRALSADVEASPPGRSRYRDFGTLLKEIQDAELTADRLTASLAQQTRRQ